MNVLVLGRPLELFARSIERSDSFVFYWVILAIVGGYERQDVEGYFLVTIKPSRRRAVGLMRR